MTDITLLCHQNSDTHTFIEDYVRNQGYTIRSTKNPDDIGRENLLVRWGSRARIRYRQSLVLNTKAAIGNASNKLKAIRIFHEANIPCPHREGQPMQFPCYVFQKSHMGGNGIVFCLSKYDLDFLRSMGFQVAYWSVPLQIVREYRVHAFKMPDSSYSNVLLKKVYKGIYDEENDTWDFTWKPDMFICRHHGSYVLNTVRDPSDIERKVIEIGNEAIDVLGLHFGAVDLCIYENPINARKEIAIFEVNTAPGLTEKSGEFYGKGIIGWMQWR